MVNFYIYKSIIYKFNGSFVIISVYLSEPTCKIFTQLTLYVKKLFINSYPQRLTGFIMPCKPCVYVRFRFMNRTKKMIRMPITFGIKAVCNLSSLFKKCIIRRNDIQHKIFQHTSIRIIRHNPYSYSYIFRIIRIYNRTRRRKRHIGIESISTTF